MMATEGGTAETRTNLYVPKPPEGVAFFDDGREIELLHFVYSLPEIEELRGNPAKILSAIDTYGRTSKYMMNVGAAKGKIVCDLIAEVKPKVMIELGGYVGYSALLFGDALRKAGGQQYHSLERNPEFAAVITSLLDLAGLSDLVKVHVGPSDQSIARLHAASTFSQIDLMFLDHYKPAYITDLKLCEHLGLIRPGSVLAADNVISPGNPPYLEYVRSTVEEKLQKFKDQKGKAYDTQEFSDSWRNQYSKRIMNEKPNLQHPGNPGLIYESQLIHSQEPTGEPDGVEISRCIGEKEE